MSPLTETTAQVQMCAHITLDDSRTRGPCSSSARQRDTLSGRDRVVGPFSQTESKCLGKESQRKGGCGEGEGGKGREEVSNDLLDEIANKAVSRRHQVREADSDVDRATAEQRKEDTSGGGADDASSRHLRRRRGGEGDACTVSFRCGDFESVWLGV